MKKITILVILTITSLLTSCIKEDHFGASDSANVLEFEVQGQSGTTIINSDADSIFLQLANGADVSKVVITKLKLSTFATSDFSEGQSLDFSNKVLTMNVKSESGKQTRWTVVAQELGSEPQIENSDFNTWYTNQTYKDIGKDDASSSWATSNPGAVFGGISPNVQQLDLGGGNYACKLITRFTQLGALVRKPIASGSVFTGDFDDKNINISNPQAAVKFGIPFTAEPKGFTIKYQYTPGDKLIDSTGHERPDEDQGDIYVLLQRKEGNTVTRVATGWFRVDSKNSSMETKAVTLKYGTLPAGTPSYMMPAGSETFAPDGTKPTHITVVFASSANGASYQGAEGSTLIVDDFVLTY